MLGSASVAIRDHLTINPVTIGPDAPLSAAVKSILQHKLSGICVVDSDNRLLGVLSELDCLNAFIHASYDRSIGVGMVQDYMTRDVDVVSLSDNIVNVANEMMAKNQRRRPVIENGILKGQITCRGLLRAVELFSEAKNYV
ncbi:MAG: CBS domain-containing protein [Oceanicoccus sp.]|jgi:CBS domain-containing protein